jgi:hypothetical protein
MLGVRERGRRDLLFGSGTAARTPGRPLGGSEPHMKIKDSKKLEKYTFQWDASKTKLSNDFIYSGSNCKVFS